MLLRTRISLFVSLAFGVICIGLVLASVVREDLIKAQYSDATITDRSTLWSKITAGIIQRMEDKAWMVAEDEGLRRAVYAGEQEAVQRLGAGLTAQLRAQGIAGRFDVLLADGELIYSSHSALFQSPVIASGTAYGAIQRGERVRGTGNDHQRNVALVLGIPLGAPAGAVGVAGMGVYATDIEEAIEEMEQATHSSVVLVNRRGRLLAGTAEALWEGLSKGIDLGALQTLQTVESEGRVYSAVVLPHTAGLGSLVGRLVSIQDVTALVRRQAQVSQVTAASVLGFLLLVLLGLGYYMSRAFAPLLDGVGVLNALSHGNLQARVEGAEGRDEVGRIAEAVNVFRANLVAFDRFRRSRERQRRRQERFIRREMMQLAETLDEAERVAVLKELAQLEHLVRGGPDEEERAISIADATGSATSALTRESDSLAMTALAFQTMSDRVRSQNQSLREALAAKNAFIALQRELDIAARVQLSLLPDTVPLSETVSMSGIMRPAKEVGGDFYDFFRLDEHRLGVVVADVSGKGVPAALFMVMARTVMRATAVRHIEAPGRVLASVNTFLADNNSEELFVTLFYGVVDERDGCVVYANGGHNPPVVVERGGGVETLATTGGVALGMFEGLDYADARRVLAPGERLVLFSDGVTEAFDADEEAFGDDRLLDTARALPEEGRPDEDVAGIVAAVDTFAGDAPQFDDITCVVLVYAGEPGHTGDPPATV